jgi:hypothetical protein
LRIVWYLVGLPYLVALEKYPYLATTEYRDSIFGEGIHDQEDDDVVSQTTEAEEPLLSSIVETPSTTKIPPKSNKSYFHWTIPNDYALLK